MKKAFWLLTGIAAGLVIAKRLDENPKAQAVVDDAAKRAKDFGAAIAEGFRERETELTAAAKPAAKKAPVNKPAAKVAAKPVVKKAAAKKTTPAKKPVAKKAAPKQSAAKSTATA